MSADEYTTQEADVIEAKLKADQTLRHDERSLPINTDAPLPLTVKTLRNIPPEKRPQYQPEMDGETFTLRWIHNDDERSMAAHEELIAKAGLKVLNAGDTPQLIAERKKQGEAIEKKILAMANTADAADEIARVESKYRQSKQDVQSARDTEILAIRQRYNNADAKRRAS